MNALKNRLEIVTMYLRDGDDDSKGISRKVALQCLGECMAIAEAMSDLSGMIAAVRVNKKGDQI